MFEERQNAAKITLIGPALEEEVFYELRVLGLSGDFFETGTMDDRFRIYGRILSASDGDPAGMEVRFARTAPQYELYRYAWAIVRRRFPSGLISGREEDIEMVFLEAILHGMQTFDPEKGRAGDYFGTRIHAAVYAYLNAGDRKMPLGEAGALRYIEQIGERLHSAGFSEVSEGDYSLELDNTQVQSNRLTRKSLRRLIALSRTGQDISLDAGTEEEDGPSLKEVLPGGEDPEGDIVQKDLRRAIISCIRKNAAEENDAKAFLALYYDEEENVLPEQVIAGIYRGTVTRRELDGRMARLRKKLREDPEFLDLVGAEEYYGG